VLQSSISYNDYGMGVNYQDKDIDPEGLFTLYHSRLRSTLNNAN
jgi:hypothetical protein